MLINMFGDMGPIRRACKIKAFVGGSAAFHRTTEVQDNGRKGA